MACNVFDSEGNKISTSEAFVKSLYEGKLDELIKSKAIDDSKFKQDIIVNKAKLATPSSQKKEVFRVIDQLLQNGTTQNNLVRDAIKQIPELTSDELVKLVGEYRGRKYDFDFSTNKIGISKAFQRGLTSAITEEEAGQLEKSSEYESENYELMDSKSKELVRDAFKEGIDSIKDLYSDLSNNSVVINRTFRSALIIEANKTINKLYDSSSAKNKTKLESIKSDINALAAKDSSDAGKNLYIYSLKYSDAVLKANKLIEGDDELLKKQLNTKTKSGETVGSIIKDTAKNIEEIIDDAAITFKDSKELDEFINSKLVELTKAKSKAKDVKLAEKQYREERKKEYEKDKQRYFNSSLPILNEAGISYGIDMAKSYIREGIVDLNVLKKKLDVLFDKNVSEKDLNKIIDEVKESDLLKNAKNNVVKVDKPIWKQYQESAAKALLSKLNPKTLSETPALEEFANRLISNLKERFISTPLVEYSKLSKEKAIERFTKEVNDSKLLNEKDKEYILNYFNESKQELENIKKGIDLIKSRSLINRMNEVISNLDKYKDVVEQTRKDILENPNLSGIQKLDKLSKLEEAVGNIFEKPLSDKVLNSYLKDQLKSLGETISTYSKLEPAKQRVLIDDIVKELAETIGITDALKLKEQVKNTFAKLVADKAEKELSKSLEKSGSKKNQLLKDGIVKYSNKKLLDYIYQGALKEEYNDLILDTLGISRIPNADRELLKKYADEIGNLEYSTLQDLPKQELTNLIDELQYRYGEKNYTSPLSEAIDKFIRKTNLRSIVQSLSYIQITQMLSGTNTAIRNEASVLHKLADTMMINKIIKESRGKVKVEDVDKLSNSELKTLLTKTIGKAATLTFIKDIATSHKDAAMLLFEGVRDPYIRATGKSIYATGFNIIDSSIEANKVLSGYEKYANRLANQVMSKSEWNKLSSSGKLIMKGIFVNATIMSRSMLARDAMNRLAMNDYFIKDNMYNELLMEFEPNSKEFSDKLNDLWEEYSNDKKDAIKVATVLIEEQIKSGNTRYNKGHILPLAYDILKTDYSEHINYATEMSKRMTEQNTPDGTIGELLNAISGIAKIPIVGKLIFAFPRAGLNALNWQLQRSPIGIARGLLGGHIIKRDRNRPVSTQERYAMITQGVIGTIATTALATLMLLVYAPDDDEEGAIDPEIRKAIKDAISFSFDTQNQTMKLKLAGKEFNINYSYLNMGLMLNTLGMLDKYIKTNEETDWTDFTLEFISSYYNLVMHKIAGDPAKNLGKLIADEGKGKGSLVFAAQAFKRMIPGFGSNLINDATKVATYDRPQVTNPNKSVDNLSLTYNIFEKDTPLVYLDDEKAIDAIGNPVRNNFKKLAISSVLDPIFAWGEQWKKEHIFENESKDKWIDELSLDERLPIKKWDVKFNSSIIPKDDIDKTLEDIKLKIPTDVKKWYPSIDKSPFQYRYAALVGTVYKKNLENSKSILTDPKVSIEDKKLLISSAKESAKKLVDEEIEDKLEAKFPDLAEKSDVIKENKEDTKSSIEDNFVSDLSEVK